MRKWILKMSFLLCITMLFGACYSENKIETDGSQKIEVRDEDSIQISADLEDTDSIRMVDFTGNRRLGSWISEFNRSHEDTRIEMCYPEMSDDDLWNATMTELVAGNGPDVFCMWSGDERIKSLYEKGILADLNEYVELKLKNQIFPGIIESGIIDQEWIGLGVEGMPITLIVSDILWDKENWTLDDIVLIAKDNTGLDGLFAITNSTSVAESDPVINAELLLDNPYIFIEQNKSCFDSKLFKGTLELLKQYKARTISKSELSYLLNAGKMLGAFMRLHYPQEFVEAMNEYCYEGSHFVGMVGQEGYVGEWTSVYLIMVNKNTKHVDDIKRFMEGMLDYDKQSGMDMTMSVREDVVRNKVIWAEWSEQWEYKLDNKTYIPFTRPDGKSYLEEYISFLKKLGPCREQKDAVYKIVIEEVRDYLNTSKSISDIVESIDKRITLYLLEN